MAVAALVDGKIGMRDTKTPDGPVLAFSKTEWAALLEQIKGSVA